MANTTMQRTLPGRSSSQLSIDEYPEHLNPFYEDDNHRRLRFWKSSSKGSAKTSRSNSFVSLSGLKDIWTFKTFKMKKKSSTLGINKTSESPPMLRHQVHPVYDPYSTVDSHSVRHTHIGNAAAANQFDRGAGYRSSLQNVHSVGLSPMVDGGFQRNNRYRNTMQNGFQTTPLNRSVTPVPYPRHMAHGSSLSSLNSTNPFDDDDDTVSRVTTIDGMTVRKPGRKKRRAPPPPTMAASISSQSITTVEETPRGLSENGLDEIHNLTSEIECFVRKADTDKEKLRTSPEKIPTTTSTPIKNQIVHTVEISSPPNNGYTTTERVSSSTSTKSRVETKDPSEESRRRSPDSTRASPENNEEYLVERVSIASSQTPSPPPPQHHLHKVNSEKELNITEEAAVVVESPTAKSRTPPRIFIREATVEAVGGDVESQPLPAVPTEKRTASSSSPSASPTTPRSSEVDYILEQREVVRSYHTPTVQTVDHELRITESLENLVDDDGDAKSSTTPPIDKGRFQIRFVPLNNISAEEMDDADRGTKSANGKVHDDDADVVIVTTIDKRNPPPPPPRRRSVSDIIASIEKCQSRLKLNQQSGTISLSNRYNFEPVKYGPKKSTVLDTSSKEYNNNDIDARHIPVTVEQFNISNSQQDDELFKKCVVMREKTISSADDGSTIDWNPVPKPRRSRNLTHEVEMAQLKNI